MAMAVPVAVTVAVVVTVDGDQHAHPPRHVMVFTSHAALVLTQIMAASGTVVRKTHIHTMSVVCTYASPMGVEGDNSDTCTTCAPVHHSWLFDVHEDNDEDTPMHHQW